jgi:hypothetical protein
MPQMNLSTLQRLMNQALNPFWGLRPTIPQAAVYRHGVADPAGCEGGWPHWSVADFLGTDGNGLPSGDSQDTVFTLPEGFTLMGLFGSSDQEAGSPLYNTFAVTSLYDVQAQIPLIMPAGLNGVVVGTKGTVVFNGMRQLEYYTFEGSEPQCQVRITNLAASTAKIQMGLFGIVGGAK